jgi:hypothetical protein
MPWHGKPMADPVDFRALRRVIAALKSPASMPKIS